MNVRLIWILPVLCTLLTGCGDEPAPSPQPAKQVDWEKRVAAAGSGDQQAAGPASAAGTGGVTVTLTPQNPTAGGCLQASVSGTPATPTFTWEVNGLAVLIGNEGHYCLETAVRGDTVTVSVGDATAGATAAVTVANTPPRITDSRFEMVAEGSETYLEVNPQVEDPDQDLVTLSYQWLINGEVNDQYTENRLPDTAYSKGDTVRVKIVPDDSYAKGPVYETRSIDLSGGAPTIGSRPPASFQAMEYSYQVEASDPDNDILAYTLAEAPEGMTIDADTGAISWPLDTVKPGEYPVKIVVSDPDGGSAIQEFTISLGERTPKAE